MLWECRVELDRLDINDITVNAGITLRKSETPHPSESALKYHIDDVNTDDSTDDKKQLEMKIPKWVKILAKSSLYRFT